MNKFEVKDYYAKYVAIDDKDRIISFASNKTEAINDSIDYNKHLDEFGVRIYPIIDRHIKDTLKELVY